MKNPNQTKKRLFFWAVVVAGVFLLVNSIEKYEKYKEESRADRAAALEQAREAVRGSKS